MKTYLFDTINRYKRFSETLDIQTKINNKSWWVFNDNGQKELYIFQPNNQCYVTSNGIGIQGNWEYITANKSLIINVNKNVLMLHPVFMDDNLLTLNLDGTNQYSFLIEEQNKENFAPNTLSQLMAYFENKERLAQEAERKRIDEELKKAEEKKNYEEAERKRQEEKEKDLLQGLKIVFIFLIIMGFWLYVYNNNATKLYEYINEGIFWFMTYIGIIFSFLDAVSEKDIYEKILRVYFILFPILTIMLVFIEKAIGMLK